MNRPITTLFMLMSVDGKISTGDVDTLDVDKDFPRIMWVKEWLYQYYELEQETDIYSLISGKVLAKIGINNKQDNIKKLSVSFLVIDNKPHLTSQGIENLLTKSKRLFICTTNKAHPAFEKQKEENIEIIYYENIIDFRNLFQRLKNEFSIDNITIQTGGELNNTFLRNNIIDKISIVIAPVLIGGKNTSSLIDGESLHTIHELINIKALKLEKANILKYSYIHLKYDVINETEIEWLI